MSAQTFHIQNREALLAEQALLPFARYISRLLTSSGVIRELSHDTRPPQGGWIVFRGEGEAGFGVRLDQELASLSSLQRSLDVVRCAHAVVRGFGGPGSFPFTLSLAATPPPSWRVCKVVGVVRTVWCGSSLPIPQPPVRTVEDPRNPKVRTRLFALVSCDTEVNVGSRICVEEVALRLPEIGVFGRSYFQGEAMSMKVEEANGALEQSVPGVRLDLGEVEVRLSDIVSLRPGTVLDLGGAKLERCYVRIGSTVLAEGRFDTHEGKLTLTIESVV